MQLLKILDITIMHYNSLIELVGSAYNSNQNQRDG